MNHQGRLEFKVTRILLLFIFLISGVIQAKQEVDLGFVPKNNQVVSKEKIVLIDEAHHNFHTLDGRYKPFAKVLESAGYSVEKNINKFTSKSLENVDVLVIANALDEKNVKNHDLPNFSAFTQKEVEVVHHWVKNGGSLLLIADHLPWPKASDSLASTFGFQFNNSYVEVLGSSEQYFEVADKSLVEHKILKGLTGTTKITKIRGFMGQAFLSPPDAKPLLVFSKSAVAYMPSKAWDITDDTPTISAVGWHQGATLDFYKGRVAFFGEAGMFTAQVDNDENEQWKMGMNAKGAEQNEQFLLNTMYWLSNII
ncbi:hypothetical protein SOPP22_14295 [Shewanella sp. OPT22]|nr:hypothetical protein SOPP22_14295 [Shewanella sp. OPT22]